MLKFVAPTTRVAIPEPSCEDLAATLRNGGAVERLEAARRLRGCGSPAVPLLCGALTDPCVPVRLAAAESLGEIGDPAAIPPLTQALQGCFHGGSARRQLATGCLGTGLALIVCLLMVLLNPFVIIEGLFRAGLGGLSNLGKNRSEPELRLSRAPAYARALAQIAERHPTPELRALLPELRAASLDLLQLDREARQVSRETAERIERLTTLLKTLPTPAHAPTGGAENRLPRPAEPSGPRGALPRSCE